MSVFILKNSNAVKMGEVMGAVLIFYMQSMIRVHSTGRNVTLHGLGKIPCVDETIHPL